MTNILNLASNALMSYSTAIQTTGNNISNVNTEGYSRQVVEFEERFPTRLGPFYVGSGIKVGNIERISDELANQRLRESISIQASFGSYYERSSAIDSNLAISTNSLSTSMQSFFESLHNLTDSPDFSPARQSFFTEAELMVDRFSQVNSTLSDEFIQLNQQIKTDVATINNIAESIADLNAKIVSGEANTNSVLDKRDNLLNQLSALIDTDVIPLSDGSITVSVGSGQSLVVGTATMTLVAQGDAADPRQFGIFIARDSVPLPITDSVVSGELGGLLAYREEVLLPAQNSISRTALAIADNFNEQHKLGMDLNDNLGGNFFNDINTTYLTENRVIPNLNNAGNASFTVNIDDTSALTTADYRLTVGAGPSYTLTNLSDNTAVTVPGFPHTVDGFTIDISAGAVAVGDQFIVSPTNHGADQFSLAISNIGEIALASPIRTNAALSNTGDAKISAGVVTDVSTADFTTTPKTLTPPVRVEFLSATSYQLVNDTTSAVIEGPIAYDPTTTNELFPTPGAYDPGYRVQISGEADTNDTFLVEYNNGGRGDSRNALSLVGLQNSYTLNGGTQSFQSSYGDMLTSIGTRTAQSEINHEASTMIRDQAQASVENLSGVNLDEEAANLIKFEQAYQAASQLIQIANNIFNTLIGIMR